MPATESPARILVLEDYPMLRETFRRVLTHTGLIGNGTRYPHVDAVGSIPDALDWLTQHDGCDLILADVALPSGEWAGHPTPADGIAFAEVVCQRWPETRFVFVSSYPSTDLVRWGVVRPGMPFLAKPFAAGELLRAVALALETRPCLLPERRAERRIG